jgi:anti-sigma regulatory factor (Ser/Thr protein kinase)
VLSGTLAIERPVPERRVEDLRLAVTEACANVVTHAYPGAAAGSMEVLGARNEDGRAVVTVRDRGLGVQRDAENVEAGMGIALIGAPTENLEFAHADDGTHEVRMVFARSAP